MAYQKQNWIDGVTPLNANRLNNIEDGIEAVDSALTSATGTIQNQISALANGTPLTADTIAAMTDTSKLYIYTGSEAGYTNGDWYYWNGTAWSSGGAYGQGTIDSALSGTSTNPVENRVIKNEIDSKYTEFNTYRTSSQNAIESLQTTSGSLVNDLDQLRDDFDDYESSSSSAISSLQSTVTQHNTRIESNESNVDSMYDEFDGYRTEANGKFDSIFSTLLDKVDGAEVEDGYLYLTSNGERVTEALGPFNGGGGSGGGGGNENNAIISLSNTSGWLSKTISDTEDCSISFTWSSDEDGIATGAGTITLKVNGTTKIQRSIEQGAVTVDVTRYLSNGTNVVRVSVSDVYGNTRTLSFSISVVAFNLSSTFDDTLAYDGAVVFPYVATGATTKRMQFVLDGTVIGYTDISTSGRQQNYTIPAQTHGSHTFELYFTADVNGSTVESNHLYYDIIFIESGNNTPIISSSLKSRSANQYYTVTIPYTVYTPNSMTSDVEIWEDGELKQELSVDRTKHQYAFRAYTTGTVTVEIKSGATTKQFEFTVIPSIVDVEAETNGLDLYLSPAGRSNSEENPGTWTNNGYSSTFTGFDWSSNGWLNDSDGNQVLRLTSNARVNIGYQLFGSDFRTSGKTIEVDFATSSVADGDAVMISCLDGTRGIYFTPTHCSLASEQISVEGTYKDEEHTRVSFVIEKIAENRLIYIYINGIISGLIQYPSGDNFQQVDPVGITLGSNYCTLDIYAIRIYNNSLTRYQILDNWIADTADGYTLLQRYEHNNVYDAYGNIVIQSLPNDLPYMVLSASELPQFKGDKKTIYGYYVDPLNQAKSFTFTGAQIDVQGTSSQFYARKNYKIKFNGGFDMTETIGETLTKYQLRADSIPTKTFTMKADVASSEGANNVELARLYDDICPYKTDPQRTERADGNKVRQGIDGFPIVIFWNDTVNDRTIFLGKYNFNNDKGTEDVFGLNQGDESWEIRNNVSNRVLWKSADYSDTSAATGWPADFEARYPEDSVAIGNLQSMAAWLVTTDRDAATDNTLAEAVTYDGVEYTTDSAAYRLAKFKNEVDQYWSKQDLIFYYMFTELFLMVDSRGKNMFPTLYEGDRWALLPYDFDTAIGIDNNGKLAFGWWLEDTDLAPGTDSTNVYNAQNSVLWVNTRDAFGAEIKAMYQQLRNVEGSNKLSYETVEGRFEDHQSKWPEAIFNEDAYFKYIAPLTNPDAGKQPDPTYLVMAQGSKASQRQWWLYNRFKYLDSKYETGEALSKYMYFKTNGVGDITVTPFDNVYMRTMFGQAILGPVRGTKDTPYTFTTPLDTANDTEVAIYSADYIKDIGDISALKVSVARINEATRLTSLKVGDDDTEYSNTNLTELTTGTNFLLRTIDASNCPNLTSPIDLSQCHNLETVKFGGTGITGINLPNGGNLQTLVLPSTIANLTIRNQSKLSDLTIPSYSQLTSLWIENLPNSKSSEAYGGDADGNWAKLGPYKFLYRMSSGARVRMVNEDIYVCRFWGYPWNHSSMPYYNSKSTGTVTSATSILNLFGKFSGIDAAGNNTERAQLVNCYLYLDSISKTAYDAIKEIYPNLHIKVFESWNGTVTTHRDYVDATYYHTSDSNRRYDFYNITPHTIYAFTSENGRSDYSKDGGNIKFIFYNSSGTQTGNFRGYARSYDAWNSPRTPYFHVTSLMTPYDAKSCSLNLTASVSEADFQSGQYRLLRSTDPYFYEDSGFYTVTNILKRVTNSCGYAYAENNTYNATLSAGPGTLTATITMGGVDVTSSVYNSSTGEINIPNVTGNIVINAYADVYLLRNWDFTSSLVDSVASASATTTAARDSTGLKFTAANTYAVFSGCYGTYRTFELDVAEIGTAVSNVRRVLMADTDANTSSGGAGLILRNTNSWSYYNGSTWGNWGSSGFASDVGFLNGKTLKIFVDENNRWYAYVKTTGSQDSFTLIGTASSVATLTSGNVYFGGSTSDGLAAARFTGFRVYNGKKLD